MAGSGSGPSGRGGDRAASRRRSDGEPGAERAAGPLLTVVRGDATAEEIAALTAVLAAKSAAAVRAATAAAAAARGGRTFGWASRQAMLRKPLAHGPGAWRASARPGA
jgi:hypothetical protein